MTVPHVMATLRADLRRSGDMDHAQFRVLMAILHGASSTGDLAERFEVSAPTMTRTVDVLVERGWVTRARDERDRRRVLVSMTGDGRDRMRRLQKESVEHLAGVLDGLDATELERLCDGLAVLREAVNRHRDSLCDGGGTGSSDVGRSERSGGGDAAERPNRSPHLREG